MVSSMNINETIDKINNNQDLSLFIDNLREDLENSPDTWTNQNLADFLESMSAWVNSMDQAYKNNGQKMPEGTDFQTFARILSMAKIYE